MMILVKIIIKKEGQLKAVEKDEGDDDDDEKEGKVFCISSYYC